MKRVKRVEWCVEEFGDGLLVKASEVVAVSGKAGGTLNMEVKEIERISSECEDKFERRVAAFKPRTSSQCGVHVYAAES